MPWWVPRRRWFFLLIIVLVYLTYPPVHQLLPFRSTGGHLLSKPPTYEDLYEIQRKLPQHNLSLPYPEGQNGRYVKFSNQLGKLGDPGWNNVFNEILLCTHLAHESNRAYVFQDFVWAPKHYPWKIEMMPWQNHHAVKPHTPLNALISGPTVGSPWEEGDTAPRAVSEAWFDVVCPPSSRHIIYTHIAKAPVRDASAVGVLAYWTALLRDIPERCVEVVPGLDRYSNPQVFDLWVISMDRVLPLWPSYSKSTTSRLLGTSPLVKSAVARNEYLFSARGSRPAAVRDPYERMMALHVRRGDYLEACVSLSKWGAKFYGWNLLPGLPDPFSPPPGGDTAESARMYRERCLPTVTEVVEKVRKTREEWEKPLDVVFVATNADKLWVKELDDALRRDGWLTVVTSRDLTLDVQQTGVSMAVDMDIVRQAAVFIGNGWSSLTSNVIHRRLVDGKAFTSHRFW